MTVVYDTANNSMPTAGSDYTTASGTLTFAAGQPTRPITVAVSGDTDVEANETFTVDLSRAANASVSDGQAIGTIANDDCRRSA